MAEQESIPAVDEHGQIFLRLEGEDFVLRPSRQAISLIEGALGKPLLEIATECASKSLAIDALALIICEMIKAYGRTLDAADPRGRSYRAIKVERIAELIFEAGLVPITARVGVVLMGALTGGYSASGEIKATS